MQTCQDLNLGPGLTFSPGQMTSRGARQKECSLRCDWHCCWLHVLTGKTPLSRAFNLLKSFSLAFVKPKKEAFSNPESNGFSFFRWCLIPLGGASGRKFSPCGPAAKDQSYCHLLSASASHLGTQWTGGFSASRFIAMDAVMLSKASGWTWPGFSFTYCVCKVATPDNTRDPMHKCPEKKAADPRRV